jgi:S-adenosylmethionine hydrolase
MGPLFTLTTDFGCGSGYPAQMKGVLLSSFPDARIVDVSHDVPHFDVLAGALLLEACVPRFPHDAIHVAVVDPGVGTSRRGICVVSPDGGRLVGPDNGLFTPFLGPGGRVLDLTNPDAVPSPEHATFHGRDLFVPAAIFLAEGGPMERLGRPVADPVRLPWPSATRAGDAIEGETVGADPFGNVITSIRASDVGRAAVRSVEVGGRSARWVHTFGDGAEGELVALVGSGGRVEIAVREGSAAAALARTRGVAVRVVVAG